MNSTKKKHETNWQRFADAQPQRKSVDPDDRVQIALLTGSRRFDLVRVDRKTYRIRYLTVGQNFGTVGVVEDSRGEEVLHETDTMPIRATASARDAAVRWILEEG